MGQDIAPASALAIMVSELEAMAYTAETAIEAVMIITAAAVESTAGF